MNNHSKNTKKSKNKVLIGVVLLAILLVIIFGIKIFSKKGDLTWTIEKGEDVACISVIAKLYEDNKYEYTVANPCVLDYKVVYSNGEKYTIGEALSKKKVTVNELIKKGVKIYKNPKNS